MDKNVYKLTIEKGGKFDIAIGYFAQGISFREVADVMNVSSTNEDVPTNI